MDREKCVHFLFAMVKLLKVSYESPVVLLTQTDYADDVFKTLENVRGAHLQNEPTENVSQIIDGFHFGWLEAVQEVDNWKKQAKDTPRETIFNSVDYTIGCIRSRHKRFEKFVANTLKLLTQAEKAVLDAETDVIKDLRDINISALLEKQRCLGKSVDKTEFMGMVTDEINELLYWLDRLSNFLVLQLCKLLDMNQLSEELAKTLYEAIKRMDKGPEESIALQTGRTRSFTPAVAENEIVSINAKIKKLEDRISQLREEKSSSNNPLALQHKAIFLEERLESLENLRTSLSCFNRRESNMSHDDHISDLENNIFNHLLPHDHRCWLVENLIQEWDNALNSSHVKSLISVMRAPETIEEFSDEYGHFTVDYYGRKIYKSKTDDTLYQLDGTNTLVPVNDDENHVYYYDALGRYYLTEDKSRVYKAYRNASEYILDSTGMLLKLRENIDGVEYLYDSLGRYYINDEGEHIYNDPGSTEEYMQDGLGNLVRIRYEDQSYLTYCPIEPMVTEESLYLKNTVGEALKKCVAEVCLLTPEDPVKYLAECLIKYHNDMILREEIKLMEKEMFAERERLKALEREKTVKKKEAEPSVYEESTDERSTIDENFVNYGNI